MEETQTLNGAKRNEIRKLLQDLEADLEERNFTPSAKLQILVRLKSQIISAEVAAFFTENDIRTLCHYAFYQSDFSTGQSETIIQSSHVALKCLANVLLLEKTTRQIFVDGRYAEAVAILLNRSQEDELLCSRILFLLTYDTKFEFDELFEDLSLAESIHKNIAFHAVKYVKHKEETEQAGKGDSLPTLNPAALTESLKLLFNLTQFYPRHSGVFVDTIEAILEILTSIQLQPQALQPPVTQLINALLSLDLPGIPDSEDYTPLFPKYNPNQNHLRLIAILNSAVRTLKEEDLETVVPLVTLLRRVYELAPLPIKQDIQAQLLPSNSERAQPLGKTDSLPSHLLRLSTSPHSPQPPRRHLLPPLRALKQRRYNLRQKRRLRLRRWLSNDAQSVCTRRRA
ncbi:hypothetical protein ABVK25_005598 [Lepraria finkii]|uniref:Uncharacterized protein n=1 Tax=Lepraria finkii TaxID=1340010 RepID=A0ABR4B877_9LECA